uniref:Uncharacterized protein n=1 Tax=Leersia perrieri TaxID=77586 RepID=A0A0D9XTY7_9ORYZ
MAVAAVDEVQMADALQHMKLMEAEGTTTLKPAAGSAGQLLMLGAEAEEEEEEAAAAKVVANATSADAGGDCCEKPLVKKKKKKMPMPQVFVDYILAWDKAWEKEGLPTRTDDDYRSPEHRRESEELAALLDKEDDEFEVFQRQVRHEVEKHGCYMVDDTYLSEIDEMQALVELEFAKCDRSGILFARD